jgi:hypothetical protein
MAKTSRWRPLGLRAPAITGKMRGPNLTGRRVWPGGYYNARFPASRFHLPTGIEWDINRPPRKKGRIGDRLCWDDSKNLLRRAASQ